jgi:hypothetical protein
MMIKRSLFASIAGLIALATCLIAAEETRPFGKYLVKVCELGRGCYDPTEICKTSSCGPKVPPKTPLKDCTLCDVTKKPQTIKLKQVGCGVPTCSLKPKYPLQSGDSFFIQVSSDAKDVNGAALPVTLTIDGPAVVSGSMTGNIQTFVATGNDTVTIKATQAGDTTNFPASPTSIVLATVASPSADCFGLLESAVTSTEQPDIAAIANLAGAPVPFLLSTQGTGTILIYATRWPIKAPEETSLLNQVVETLNGPLGSDPKNSFGVKPADVKPVPFLQELHIAHAKALGDPGARIMALGYKFTVQNIGSTPGAVRISGDTPSCKDWTAFLDSVRALEWSLVSEPAVTQLWHLNSDDVSTAMGTLFPAASATSPPPAPSGSGSGSGTPTAASPNATVSISQPPGSKVEIKTDTTPCVVAGLSFGNPNACAPASSGSGSSATASSAGSTGPNPVVPPKPISTASIGIPNNTPATSMLPQSPHDLLIYGNPQPGDDAQIAERNRILAQLDLPRPEMIINAWVIQNSSTDARAMGDFSGKVRTLVDHYNESLEKMVLKAYAVVSEQMLRPGYFNDPFYHYVSDRFVAEGKEGSPTAQEYLDRSLGRLSDSEDRSGKLGICEKDRYCLGYDLLFRPVKPRLTDLLLALIAAQNPFGEALQTINKVQSPCCCPGNTATPACEDVNIPPPQSAPQHDGKCTDCPHAPDLRGHIPDFTCQEVQGDPQTSNLPNDDPRAKGELRKRCTTIQERLDLHPVNNYLDPVNDCTTADKWGILRSQFTALGPADDWRPRVHLVCFARAAQLYLRDAGLARAAVADFLYQYKHSQQYPHEFPAYSLSQSAASLNSVLSPIIEAFNRDVVAFQTYMRTDLEYEVEVANRGGDRRCCVKRLFGIDKPSFFNDGIVSVRTISGQAASVNATSQSYLDASKAPSLSDLLSAMGGGATSSSASPLAATLGSAATQAPVSLLGSVLGSYQKTYAQIGRQLWLQAVPRSLATASAAEISVYMKAGDPANSPTFSGGPASASQQNVSEVSNHEVTTRIRVDSLKLFELSSYSAVLQRSRSKFPLLPPFVEIPYIGTIAGIPLPAAKEYHSSTAVISAMVVPTAADIGYGLRFAYDLVIYGPAGTCSFTADPHCQVKGALSLSDLHAPVASYHDAMLLCLTSETNPGRVKANLPATPRTGKLYFMNAPSVSLQPEGGQACRDLTFSQFPDR